MFIRIDFTEKNIIGLIDENGKHTRTINYSDNKEYEKAYCNLLRELWDLGYRRIEIMTKAPDYKTYSAIIMPATLKNEEGKVVAEYTNRDVWNYVR